MTKHTIIPEGYRLTVASWENDSDHHQTKIFEGLSLISTKFLVDFSKLFYSVNDHKHKCFGNMYEPEEDQLEKFYEAVLCVVNKYLDKDTEILNEYFIDEGGCIYEDIHDSTFELATNLGLSGSEDYYTRVLNGFKVEYVPTKITLEDVTSNFI